MPAGGDPVPSYSNSDQVVQVKGYNGCPAAGRETDTENAVFAPAEVPSPGLPSRIEQGHETSANGITGSGLITLVQIARAAGQPEIRLVICSPFGNRNDVFDFELPGHVLLTR